MGWVDVGLSGVSPFYHIHSRSPLQINHTEQYRRVSALELVYLYNSDWEHAVAQAEARMRSESVFAERKTSHVGV